MIYQWRVLCVDDDDTCKLLTATLGFSGIKVKSTKYFTETLWLAETGLFDLYLLETRLPDGDGFELCRRLREFDSRTPIIFYSSEAYPADRQRGLSAGATAYLVKPFFGDLTAVITQTINGNNKRLRTSDLIESRAILRQSTGITSAV